MIETIKSMNPYSVIYPPHNHRGGVLDRKRGRERGRPNRMGRQQRRSMYILRAHIAGIGTLPAFTTYTYHRHFTLIARRRWGLHGRILHSRIKRLISTLMERHVHLHLPHQQYKPPSALTRTFWSKTTTSSAAARN